MTEGLSGPAKFLTYIDKPITEFIPFHGSYFFVANDKRDFYTIEDKFNLYLTNRYNEKTTVIKSLDNFTQDSTFDFVIHNNYLYFWDGVLWRSDGTPNGTVLIKGIDSELNRQSKSLFVHDNKIYFRSIDSQGSPGGALTQKPGVDTLWVSGGSFATTKPVAQFFGFLNSPFSSNVTDLDMASHNGSLYFTANDGTHGTELWRLATGTVEKGMQTTFFGSQGAFKVQSPNDAILDNPPPTGPGLPGGGRQYLSRQSGKVHQWFVLDTFEPARRPHRS